jgi:hypothetical protein
VDFSEAQGGKYRKNSKGVDDQVLTSKATDFAALTVEAEALSQIFLRLGATCFAGGASIEKNFVVSRDGRVSVPVRSNFRS